MSDNKKKVSRITELFTTMVNDRSGWKAAVNRTMQLVVPSRSSMDVTTEQRSYNQNDNRFDTTASTSLNLWANGMLGNVASQKSTWFKLILENHNSDNVHAIGGWLDQITDTFYKLFSKTSFYQSAWEIFFDAGGSGLGTMYIGENLEKEAIDFISYDPKGVYLEINAEGQVDTLIYQTIMSGKALKKEYGEENFPPGFADEVKKNPLTRYEILKSCMPRELRDPDKIDSINKEFESMHILKSKNHLLRESGFDSFPYSLWRYQHAAEDVYPLSPSLIGYPDINRLNNVSKSTTRLAQLVAEPPMAVPAEIYDSFEIKPRFKIKTFDMNRLPTPLNMGQGYPIGLDREEHYRKIVQEHYFTNFFLMMAAATGQKLTATQVIEMQGEKATVIGGIVSRLTQEFFDPLFDRMFMIAARNNWIPEPPEELFALGGDISIDYLGILPMAQKRMLEVSGPMNALQNFLPIAQAWPEMANLINPYELGKTLLVGGGMPHSVLRDEDEYDQITEQQQQAAAEAQRTEQI